MGKSLLVLGIASLDIVIDDGVEEVLLLFGQLAIESAAVCQPLVVMGVRWFVRLSAAPVGLQSFLNGLMAHEGDIEQRFALYKSSATSRSSLAMSSQYATLSVAIMLVLCFRLQI